MDKTKISKLGDMLGAYSMSPSDSDSLQDNLTEIVKHYKNDNTQKYDESMQNILTLVNAQKLDNSTAKVLIERIHYAVKCIAKDGIIDPKQFYWGEKHEFQKMLNEQEEKQHGKTYKQLFMMIAKEMGIDPEEIEDLSAEKKKKFFDKLDKMWDAGANETD